MSRSIDLFISSPATLPELATTIAERAGLEFVGGNDESVVLMDGRLSLRLDENHFVDDDDLVLSRYSHVLSARTQASGHLGVLPETALLRRVAAAISELDVLLVLDLQYRAALVAGEEG